MATDFSTRPKPPVLKRFANLEIDGVDKPERRAPEAPVQVSRRAAKMPSAPRPPIRAEPAAPRQDADLRDFELLAEDLNANARAAQEQPARSGPRPRFTMPMTDSPAGRARDEQATELSRLRPPDPPRRQMITDTVAVRQPVQARPMPAPVQARQPMPPPGRSGGMTTSQVSLNMRLWEQERAPGLAAPSAGRAPPVRGLQRDELDMLEGMTPGVVTMEMDLRDGRYEPRAQRHSPTPIELTPMAARQIMLMSWEAGVPGSALRILTSSVGGLGHPEIDFAFDEHLKADDVVFESHGVTVVVDPASLRWVVGRRINWHDVPGSEGFRVI